MSRQPPEYYFPPPTPAQIENTRRQYRPPAQYDILADYGDGFIRVATHTTPIAAAVQAETRFINTTARAVIVRRRDRPLLPVQDSDGKTMEWSR